MSEKLSTPVKYNGGNIEEELAIFDVLHRVKVEAVDWQPRENASAAVRMKTRKALDAFPSSYEENICGRKADRTYDWIMQSADGHLGH